LKLVFIHGPAAAGKLTTARALSELTGLPVFHNHLVVDTLLTVFPFGSEEFIQLRDLFWMRTFEAAAASDRSLIFTFAPERTVPEDFPARAADVVRAAGGRVHFVALQVSREQQEARIGNLDRRQHKKLADLGTLRSIRDADASAEHPMQPLPTDLTIDTDRSSAEQSAIAIRDAFSIAYQEAQSPYPSAEAPPAAH
jgi:chloramphenicol 3-O-phosphotransferase